jgi:hypothetical protein
MFTTEVYSELARRGDIGNDKISCLVTRGIRNCAIKLLTVSVVSGAYSALLSADRIIKGNTTQRPFMFLNKLWKKSLVDINCPC